MAGYYKGVLVDYRTTGNGGIDFFLFSSGRILFLYNSTVQSFVGFGSLGANNTAIINCPGVYHLSFPFSFDGDTLFGLSTARRPAADLPGYQAILIAAADVVARAVVRALLAAAGVRTPGGSWRGYRELVPVTSQLA